MSGATSPQHPERKVWVNPSSSSQWMTGRLAKNSKGSSSDSLEGFFSVDDIPDFHDPYSELSLFLSQKLKVEMRNHGWIKKWSIKLQEALLKNVVPEFQKKFPHYRLGVTALRTTWEKIAFFTDQLEHQKEAIGQNGQLNVDYLIRENLRQYPQLSTMGGFHPYQYAHQLALKISECVAVIDGVKPPMDDLCRTIWAMQRHMLSLASQQEAKSPYDAYDQLDKIIVKNILDITAHDPLISSSSLEEKIKEPIQKNEEIVSSKTPDDVAKRILFWCRQGDLLCRCVRFDRELPLLQRIVDLFIEQKREGLILTSKEFVDRICHEQVGDSAPLFLRIMTLYKYAWYTLLSDAHESSVDRYVKWHRREMHGIVPQEEQVETLRKQFQASLPLIPFDEK